MTEQDRVHGPLYAALRRIHPFLSMGRIRRDGEWTHGVTMWVTTRCNQRCPFCQAAPPKPDADPPLGDLLRAADRIASALPGATAIVTGGEPCLRPDLPELLGHWLSLRGVRRVELQTNAVPLGPHPERLVPADSDRLRFLIGMHALRPEIYDACTATRGQLPAAIEGVRRLIASGAPVELNCVVNGLNLAHIADMPALLAERLGPRSPPLHFSVMGIPEQREAGDLLVRFGDLLDALEGALRQAERLGVVIRLALSAGHAAVPACVLERRSSLPIDRQVDYEHEGSDPDPDRWWIQGSACRACARRSTCLGLPRSYAERFGFDELEPIG